MQFENQISAAYVTVKCPNVDILCGNQEEERIDKVQIEAFAGEVKVEDFKDDGENECFFNMFGQGTNLALKSLSSGKLVSNLKMYGIIVAAHKPDKARLLEVNIDFEEQTCVIRHVTRTMVTERNSRSIGREG